MTNHNPGISSHSPEEWEKIRRFFVKLYVEHGLSLQDTQRHLEVRLALTATDNEYKKRITSKWPECGKNSKGATGTSGRTRSKKASRNPDYPAYAQLNQSPKYQHFLDESTTLDDNITLVLKFMGRYIQGFYDSNPSQVTSAQDSKLDAGWIKWHHILALCQEISLFPQKKKDIVFSEGNSKTAKENGRVDLRNIVTRLFQNDVLGLLDGIEDVTTPQDLPTFWAICRILHGLSCQLGHREGLDSLLTREFVRTLHGAFGNIQAGHSTMLRQAFDHLLQMPSFEIRQITRTTRGVTKTGPEPISKINELISMGSHFSARVLSSRLGPYDTAVLQAWADQYQHWGRAILDKGVFLRHYEVAYERSKGCRPNEKALAVLVEYCYAAHYIFHDVNLAWSLSRVLWEQSGAITMEDIRWSVHVQAMVDSAKIQALLYYINHEDKVKARGELKIKKRRNHLWGKSGRRTYRKQVLRSRQQEHRLGDLPRYNFEEQTKCGLHEVVQEMISQDEESFLLFVADLHHLLRSSLWNSDRKATSNLLAAVGMLDGSRNRECHLLAAGLYDLLASLTQAAAQDVGRVRTSAHWLRKKVKDCSLTDLHWQSLMKFLEDEEQRKDTKKVEYRKEAKWHRLTAAHGMEDVEEENYSDWVG